LTCIFLASTGVFQRFWFWTFTYARTYVSSQSIADGWLAFKATAGPMASGAPMIWLIVLVGVCACVLRTNLPAVVFLFGFAVASLATVIPGLYFRPHYFLTVLPVMALFAGAGVHFIGTSIDRRYAPLFVIAAATLIVAATVQCVHRQRALLFSLTPTDAVRAIYDVNPFPEAIQIAKYIRANSAPSDKIAVIGSEPEIYFYTQQHSATGYIYTYGLVEAQPYALRMQQEMATEIEMAKPKFVVIANVATSWLPKANTNGPLFNWLDHNLSEHFRCVGLVNIPTAGDTVYHWDDDAITAVPRSQANLRIFKREERLR